MHHSCPPKFYIVAYLREAIPEGGGLVNMKTLTVAMSGCVSVVAHVDGPHLHVASTGDRKLNIFL